MAITRVKTIGTAGPPGAAAQSLSVTVPVAGVAAGNCIIVSVYAYSLTSANTVTVTDSAGNAYVKDAEIYNAASGIRVAVFSAKNALALTSGQSITMSATAAATQYLLMTAEEFAGVTLGTAADQSATATTAVAATSESVGPTGAVGQTNEFIFAAFADWTGSLTAQTWTAGAGYTLGATLNGSVGGTNADLATEYQIPASASGAYSAALTLGVAAEESAAIVTYRGQANAEFLPAAIAGTSAISVTLVGAQNVNAAPIAGTSAVSAYLVGPVAGVVGLFQFGGFVYNDGLHFFPRSHTLPTVPAVQEILQRAGRNDGQVSLGGYLAERPITLEILVKGQSLTDLDAQYRTLLQGFSPRLGYQKLFASASGDFYVNAKALKIAAKRSTEDPFSALLATVELVAVDGMGYALAPSRAVLPLAWQLVGGTEWMAPFTLPTGGTDVTYPLYTVTVVSGSLSQIWLTNTSTSQTLTIAQPVVTGDTLVIDVPNQRVLYNGALLTAPLYGAFPALDPTQGAANAYELHALSGAGTVALTAAGNEVTDANRSLAVQGDGRQNDSTIGVWPAATNQNLNGGFEGGVANWTNVSLCTVTQTNVQALFGNYCGLVQAQAGAGEHQLAGNTVSGLTVGNQYTISCFAKAGSVSWLLLGDERDAQFHMAWFDLTNGVVGQTRGTIVGASILPVGNGWYRCAVTYTLAGPGTTGRANVEPVTANGLFSYTAAGTENLYIDGVQFEVGALATPYKETNGATTTQGAGRLQALASLLNAQQGWVAVRARLGFASAQMQTGNLAGLFEWALDANNRLAVYYNGGGPNAWYGVRIAAGIGWPTLSIAQAQAVGDLVTVVLAWTGTTLAISVNGGAFVSQANTAFPTGLPALFDLGSLQTSAFGAQAASDLLWAMTGTGTLSAADLSTLAGLGNTDPAANTLPGTAQVTGIFPMATLAGQSPPVAQVTAAYTYRYGA